MGRVLFVVPFGANGVCACEGAMCRCVDSDGRKMEAGGAQVLLVGASKYCLWRRKSILEGGAQVFSVLWA